MGKYSQKRLITGQLKSVGILSWCQISQLSKKDCPDPELHNITVITVYIPFWWIVNINYLVFEKTQYLGNEKSFWRFAGGKKTLDFWFSHILMFSKSTIGVKVQFLRMHNVLSLGCTMVSFPSSFWQLFHHVIPHFFLRLKYFLAFFALNTHIQYHVLSSGCTIMSFPSPSWQAASSLKFNFCFCQWRLALQLIASLAFWGFLRVFCWCL